MNDLKTNVCRCCKSRNTLNLGRLPLMDIFSGQKSIRKFPSSNLIQCNDCHLLTRDSILKINEYNKIYETAAEDVWISDSIIFRWDQKIIRNYITEKLPNGGKLLDVGCYTGEFLNKLSGNYEKYGIEMSQNAAKIASEKGIKILAKDLYENKISEKFDVIIIMDVIEHVENPELFLINISKLLNINGVILISTGNTENWLWKFSKNKFWYSSFYEHISFINPLWINKFCDTHKFYLTNLQFFNYNNMSLLRIIKNILKSILSYVKINPIIYSLNTKDHMFIAIKRF